MGTKIFVDDLFVYNSLFIYIIIDISCWFSGKIIKSRAARLFIVAILGILTTMINVACMGTRHVSLLVSFFIPLAQCFTASVMINRCVRKEQGLIRYEGQMSGVISLSLTLYFVTIILGGVISFIYLNTYIGVYLVYLTGKSGAGSMAGHIVLNVILVTGLIIGKVFVRLLLTNQMTCRLKGQNFYDVTITMNQKSVTLKAMYDSGNNLVHPVSKRPVCVVEAGCLRELANQKIKGITCIPFTCAGGRTQMYVIQVDYMEIHKNNRETITERNALIGIYNGKLSSKNDFNMIINNVYGLRL